MGSSLVGRETELAALGALLDSAGRGRGGVMMLVGEPGIGKTRLAGAITEAAELRGFRVGWGRAWESGGAPPHYVWIEALAALGLRIPDGSLATAIESESVRFQLFRLVTRELRAACATTPILIVLDDLHVTDLASLRMFHFIARELRSMKLAIVGTRRDVDASLTPEMESTLAHIAREGRTLVIPRLARDDVGRLVREGSSESDPRREEEIFRATQGNPLFVEELVRLLDAGESDASQIPYGARDILRQRLAPLDPSARELLEIAAVAGIETSMALLARVSREETSLARETIAKAARAGIVKTVAGEKVRFRHDLYRAALYRELPAARRANLHAAIADVLEASGSPPHVEIAHHAIEAGDHPKLGQRLARAVVDLCAAYADEDAIALLERARAGVQTTERDTAELEILLGRTSMNVGDVRKARASCARAAEIARSLGDAKLFARAALAFADETTTGETEPATHRLLEEAIARDPAPELHVRLRARLAASLQPSPRPDDVARMAHDAIRDARALGDEHTLLDVLHSAGAAFGEAWFDSSVVDLARDAVRLAEKLNDRPKLFRARLRLVFALMELGDIAAADANIDALELETRATGQARYIWPVPMLRAMRALQEGRFADATALADEAGEVGGIFPAARLAVATHRMARLRAMEQGAELLALEPSILAIVARWNDADSYANMMIATIRSIAGDTGTARVHLSRIGMDSTPARIRVALGVVAATAVRVGDPTHAAELYARLAPEAMRWHVFMFGGFAAETTYARLLGGLAAMLGRHEDAQRHFETALELADAAHARPERARVLVALAALLREHGETQRAGELFQEARRIAEELRLARVLEAIPTDVSDRPAHSVPPALESRSLTLRLEGETWLLTLGEQSIRLKDGRGLSYLARLLAEPGREIHVLDLAGTGERVDGGDAGEMLDAEARAAYKRRLAELDDELREAESWNDGARVARARGEIELLSAELSRAVGLGEAPRRAGAAAERARVAVTRRIRETLKRVAEMAPDLGRYLEATVKTGIYCSYRPL